jgi:monothiol glutaredoxin
LKIQACALCVTDRTIRDHAETLVPVGLFADLTRPTLRLTLQTFEEARMDIIERIQNTLSDHRIVLFMKGTPQFPQCGFSMRTAQALKAVGAEFHAVDVLAEPEIRQNLPRYSDWPTFPQVFIDGELVGGCDIVLDLYQSGDLQKMVSPQA